MTLTVPTKYFDTPRKGYIMKRIIMILTTLIVPLFLLSCESDEIKNDKQILRMVESLKVGDTVPTAVTHLQKSLQTTEFTTYRFTWNHSTRFRNEERPAIYITVKKDKIVSIWTNSKW